MGVMFFFFKRKTAYEIRISDWSSDVCSSDLLAVNLDTKTVEVDGVRVHLTGKEYQMLELLSLRKGTTLTKEMFLNHLYGGMDEPEQVGRASFRERGCQFV